MISADQIRTDRSGDATISVDRPATVRETRSDVGAKVDRFIVLEHLGSGGMGVVYLAYDPNLDRNVALKVLRTSAALDPSASRRMLREAQALAKLSHPNVVVVHEVGTTDDGVFIAMEHVPGDTLALWLAERHDWREIVRVFVAAGRGLAAAHAAGVVHRDFKPSNVLMGSDARRPRVVDFGLARPPAPSLESGTASMSGSFEGPAEPLTLAGAVMGTPRYMSPEQHRGDAGDPKCDQYSFCVALFEAVHGLAPFTGSTLQALAVAKEKETPDTPLRAGVPSRLNQIIMRGLAEHPGARFTSMDELLARLEQLVMPRRWTNAIAVGVAVVGVAGGWLASAAPGDPCGAGRDRIAAVWSGDGRDAITEAFQRSSPALADATWERIEPALDAYAEAWTAGHRDACEATEVRHEQSASLMDRRMQCLDDGLRSFGALVRTLGDADAQAVARADAAVGSLPRLDRCHDAERLEAAMPLPDDPAVASRVEALQVAIADAQARASTGHYDDARVALEDIAGEVEALGFPPLQVEHALAHAVFVAYAGDFARGEKLLREALVGARRLRVQRWMNEAEVRLVNVLFKLDRTDEALGLSELVAADAEHDDSAEALAEVLDLRGLILSTLGRHPAAIGDLERAVALLEESGTDALHIANVRTTLGAAYYRAGDPERAGKEHLRALKVLRERLGRHPDVASSLSNLAAFQHDTGKLDASLASSEEALSIARDVLGPRHPQTATYLDGKSTVLAAMGDHEGALKLLDEALSIRIERNGRQSRKVARTLNNIGVAHYSMGHDDQAVDYFRQSLDIRSEVLGDQHPETLFALGNLGGLLAELGRRDEAEALLQRALAATIALLGEDHPDTVAARANLIRLRLDQARLPEAHALGDAMLASATRSLPDPHPLWSTVWRTMARIAGDEGRHADAIAAHERELAAAKAAGMADDIANAEESLAAARQAAGP